MLIGTSKIVLDKIIANKGLTLDYNALYDYTLAVYGDMCNIKGIFMDYDWDNISDIITAYNKIAIGA